MHLEIQYLTVIQLLKISVYLAWSCIFTVLSQSQHPKSKTVSVVYVVLYFYKQYYFFGAVAFKHEIINNPDICPHDKV